MRKTARWIAAAAVIAIALTTGLPAASASVDRLTNEALMDSLQESAFRFFWNEANPSNGLIRDRSASWSPCSIASVGFGLSAICIGIDSGWITREQGRERVLTTLETFWNGPQGSGASGYIGYKGLFYHFLDMNSATRVWDCEVSTIDSALLFAGMLDAKQYFDTDDPLEVEVRALADSIYYRADWNYFRNNNPGILMGWKPGTGFSGFGQWIGYNEAMILYILALGSPTHPVPTTAWNAWTSGYNWQTRYGYTYLNFPPLFGHQYSHCWVDFRFIQDAYMRNRGITYFENSRRAVLAQRAYCIDNPFGWTGYGEDLWGITACDGPNGYGARGAPPPQNDDGTIAPTAPGGSIAFAPEEALACLQNIYDNYATQLWGPYGFRDAFNLTVNWWATDYIGIDQGPYVLMIENHRTQGVWDRIMANPDIRTGLERAGFETAASVEPSGGAPLVRLAQNQPNPFHDSSIIRWRLNESGPVRLSLHDVQGREVRLLLDGAEQAGEHQLLLRGGDLPSGVYYYKLQTPGDEQQRRCVLIR